MNHLSASTFSDNNPGFMFPHFFFFIIRELDLEKLEADLAEQDAKGGALAKLLEAIDGELKEAAETDEREMWSYLVHDQPQIVEVEELKIRLQGELLCACFLSVASQYVSRVLASL